MASNRSTVHMYYSQIVCHLPPFNKSWICFFCIHWLSGTTIYSASQVRKLRAFLKSLPHASHSPYPLSPSSAFSTIWISLVLVSSLQLHYHYPSSSLLIFYLDYCNKTLNFPSAELQLQPLHHTSASITDTDQTVRSPCTRGINSKLRRMPFKSCPVRDWCLPL